MTMTPEQMRQVVEETLDTQLECNRYGFEDAERGEPAPPASEVEIEALGAHLRRRGLPFPPSYRQFLSLFDGIKGYRWLEHFDLRSAGEVIAEAEDDEDTWDAFEPINQFVIGNGYATAVVGFDPESADEHGEMRVVECSTDGDLLEHESFDAFLLFNLDLFRKMLARERADRAGLADD